MERVPGGSCNVVLRAGGTRTQKPHVLQLGNQKWRHTKGFTKLEPIHMITAEEAGRWTNHPAAGALPTRETAQLVLMQAIC